MSESEFWVKRWEKYYKQIPKRGLNNLTRESRLYKYMKENYPEESYGSRPWKGKPILPDRLDKILPGVFGFGALPFRFVLYEVRGKNISPDVIPRIRELTTKIIEALNNLYDNMDTVTILDPQLVEAYKEEIRKVKFNIIENSKFLGGTLEHKGPVVLLDEESV